MHVSSLFYIFNHIIRLYFTYNYGIYTTVEFLFEKEVKRLPRKRVTPAIQPERNITKRYPLQHTLSFNQLVCENDIADLFCPPSYRIHITSAEWGRHESDECDKKLTDSEKSVPCPMLNVTSIAKILCNERSQCSIPTSVEALGDSCSGNTRRYLKVYFKCKLPVQKVLACEGAGTVSLECSPGQTIEVISAFFGRDTKPVCSHVGITDTSCSSRTSTHLVKELCNKRRHCDISPVVSVFGDPCHGTFKYLEMEYSCVDCRNAQPDGSCEFWAIKGECEKNPVWMVPNCRKTCSGCDNKEPDCVNHVYTDETCNQWAGENKCLSEPSYMLTYCRKACGFCDPSAEECRDESEMETCKYLAYKGNCSTHAETMTESCLKSCSKCKVDDTTACQNLYEDDDCERWAGDGECHVNPVFMIPYCRKSCTNCDSNTLQIIGNPARPGIVETSTAKFTVILPDEFSSEAMLTYFLAFFAAKHPVSLEIWRPTDPGFYQLHYSIDVTPHDANYVQTISPDRCVSVKPGDRIGFSCKHGSCPIATNYKPEQKYAFSRVGYQERFDQKRYPYVFSFAAGFDTNNSC